MSTDTNTPFFAFLNQPRWTSVDIQEYARATVPLRWRRVQCMVKDETIFHWTTPSAVSFKIALIGDKDGNEYNGENMNDDGGKTMDKNDGENEDDGGNINEE
ncbi:hypothetical protein Tco_1503077 [Tanacetum coccineum]